MLRISVPSTNDFDLNFSTFEHYELPAPLSGVDAEVNNGLILQFEDEEEAIVYAAQLENLANDLDDKTTKQYFAIGEIITAIRSDDFVQSYNQ